MDGSDPIHIHCNKRIDQSVPQLGNYFRDGRTKIGKQHQQFTSKKKVSFSFNQFGTSGLPAFRLCAGVGNSLAEETTWEGEDDQRGGWGCAQSGEQHVWTQAGTAGTVEGKVCSESGDCWIAHGKGAVDEIQEYSTFNKLLISILCVLTLDHLWYLCRPPLLFRKKQRMKRRQYTFWNLALRGMCWCIMLRNSLWERHYRSAQRFMIKHFRPNFKFVGTISQHPLMHSGHPLEFLFSAHSRPELFPTTARWTALKFCTDIHRSQKMYYFSFSSYLLVHHKKEYCRIILFYLIYLIKLISNMFYTIMLMIMAYKFLVKCSNILRCGFLMFWAVGCNYHN